MRASHRTIQIALTTMIALATASIATAEIYQYVDDDGNLVFTTSPRAGETPQKVIGSSQADPTPEEVARQPGRPNPNPTRSDEAFDAIIEEAADSYEVPFELIKAVIRVESAFDPHAVSHAGAEGLMQLMPDTAASLNCEDPFDPRQNIMAGTQFIRMLSDRYNGNLNLILSAYNAGPGAVARTEGIPYENTRRYVERVYGYYMEYLDAASD
jgi:soluble lytic murein transglycosylase-like protein